MRGLDLLYAGRGAQDRVLQRMPLEQEPFELVVNVFGRIVFVGDDFVQHHAPFRLYLVFRERGFQRQLEQQADGLPQVLLEHRGMQYNLFLGGVGVQFAAQAVQVAVDGRCFLTARAAEQRMLHEMSYSRGKARFLGGATADRQGAIGHRPTALANRVFKTAGGLAASHRPLAIRLRSSARKPTPAWLEILWRRR